LNHGLIRQELLSVAQEVAREKSIDKERIFAAIEESFVKAAAAKYGEETPLSCKIDRKSGEIFLYQVFRVVEAPEDPLHEISLSDAQKKDAQAVLDGTFYEELPTIDFRRVSAHVMRQVVNRVIKEATRENEYAEYKDKVGDIVTGSVRHAGPDSIVLDLGQAEGILLRGDLIPRELVKIGDRLRAYIREVKPDPRGYQILLSRSHPLFMDALFKQEVPEIYSGVIELKAIARDPGSRAKIGVSSNDPSLDPVGACVGVRGSRVQAVTKELQDERIDVIRWSPDPFTFLVNALTPAKVTKIIAGEKEGAVQVVVPDDQLSLAIGRRGQNVRLASQLTGLEIDIITETKESETRQELFDQATQEFVTHLGIDDVTARFLVAERFESLEDIALVEPSELYELEGITEDFARQLQAKAVEGIKTQRETFKKHLKELGADPDLLEFDTLLKPENLIELAEKHILSLQDLADLSSEELRELVSLSLAPSDADRLILKARKAVLPGFDLKETKALSTQGNATSLTETQDHQKGAELDTKQ